MAQLLAAVRTVVEAINRVNLETQEHQSGPMQGEPMIETLERDELGGFIDAVLAKTGAQFEEGDDVTSPWREW